MRELVTQLRVKLLDGSALESVVFHLSLVDHVHEFDTV
jgi:hypothetical protein